MYIGPDLINKSVRISGVLLEGPSVVHSDCVVSHRGSVLSSLEKYN